MRRIERLETAPKLATETLNLSLLTADELKWLHDKTVSLGGMEMDLATLTAAELVIIAKIRLPGE